jgi:hypothetical protein
VTDLPPVLLLDVDGVINALRPPWDDTDRAKCRGLTIRWAPTAVARIRNLHDAGLGTVSAVMMFHSSIARLRPARPNQQEVACAITFGSH